MDETIGGYFRPETNNEQECYLPTYTFSPDCFGLFGLIKIRIHERFSFPINVIEIWIDNCTKKLIKTKSYTILHNILCHNTIVNMRSFGKKILNQIYNMNNATYL